LRLFALLAFLAFPALAYTPEELLEPREIPFSCTAGVCTLKAGDLEFLVQQNKLLGMISARLYAKVKACSGRDL
jgi:hypothetical protein